MSVLKTREDIIEWVNKYNIRNYMIEEDMKISVADNVSGYFFCVNNKLISLFGFPQSVGGDFYCNNNILNSLLGCPVSVNKSFNCSNNQLSSLLKVMFYWLIWV